MEELLTPQKDIDDCSSLCLWPRTNPRGEYEDNDEETGEWTYRGIVIKAYNKITIWA